MSLKALFAWESIALFFICVADMLSTLYWVHMHMAVEANPYMNYWLQRGDVWFCAAKIVSFAPLLLVAAYYRDRRPKLVRVSLRGAIALYLMIYVGAVASQALFHA
jgi:hypothetical protein